MQTVGFLRSHDCVHRLSSMGQHPLQLSLLFNLVLPLQRIRVHSGGLELCAVDRESGSSGPVSHHAAREGPEPAMFPAHPLMWTNAWPGQEAGTEEWFPQLELCARQDDWGGTLLEVFP